MKVVSQTESVWRSLQSEPDASFTAEQLMDMRNTLSCDAILTGVITQYEPYPHMALALRLRLIDLRTGELLWGVEQVWDTADQSTNRRIKQYLHTQHGVSSEQGAVELVNMSSLKFFKFVAYEIALTL